MFRRGYFRDTAFPVSHEREAIPVPLVAAGTIWAQGLYDGRNLPVLILDGSERSDVVELIDIHQGMPPATHK
jgi:hypothetical protein